MNNLQVQEFSEFLKDISIYTKNLIIFKALESGENRIHIKSFQAILSRRMDGNDIPTSFFNGKKTIIMQLLDYFISCGEIINLSNGYYSVLPTRNVSLPVSKSILEVGQLKVNTYEKSNLGLAIPVIQTQNKVIPLKYYRYDMSLQDWISVFQKSTNEIRLSNEEYFKPTKTGFKKITDSQKIKENELYYIISHLFEEKKENYVARKINGSWHGEKINRNFWKSQIALLTSQGYNPTYKLKKIDESDDEQSFFQITLSNFLPKVEREQVYLFSLPHQLNYCKKYYVQKKYLKDFIHVLTKLKFLERNDES